MPAAPINDEAKKANQNLPGMGGIFNTVNLHVYHYAGNNPVKYVDPTGKDIHQLTDGQWTQVKNALDRAVNDLDIMINELQDFMDGKTETLSQRMLDGAKRYMDVDFDKKDDVIRMINSLGKIRNSLASLKRDDFRYNDFVFHVTAFGSTTSFVDNESRNGIYGYTVPLFRKIYLGDKFFNAGTSGIDTRQGILIHERSHNLFVLATNDRAYRPSGAAGLPGSARMRNADNWEFFYEYVMTRGY
jgi:hypothetical protein